jgi:hypothetical protein
MKRSWSGCIRNCPPVSGCRTNWSPRTYGANGSGTSAPFERYLGRNGVVVRKFFLHVSKQEQKRRFLDRIENPDKNWKFPAADARERGFWDDYLRAYEDMIQHTATQEAPCYVVPADNKWFTRVVVVAAVIDALASLDPEYPVVGPEKLKELATAKHALSRE